MMNLLVSFGKKIFKRPKIKFFAPFVFPIMLCTIGQRFINSQILLLECTHARYAKHNASFFARHVTAREDSNASASHRACCS